MTPAPKNSAGDAGRDISTAVGARGTPWSTVPAPRRGAGASSTCHGQQAVERPVSIVGPSHPAERYRRAGHVARRAGRALSSDFGASPPECRTKGRADARDWGPATPSGGPATTNQPAGCLQLREQQTVPPFGPRDPLTCTPAARTSSAELSRHGMAQARHIVFERQLLHERADHARRGEMAGRRWHLSPPGGHGRPARRRDGRAVRCCRNLPTA